MDYYDRGLLPEAGGTLDQNPHIMRSFGVISTMIAWHMENEKRPDVDDLPGLDDFDE